MEALTALALAGNALQFIEAGVKVAFRATEFYKATDGVPERQQELTTIAAQLKDLCEQIQASIKIPPQVAVIGPFVKTALEACTECQAVAADFQNVISKLTVNGDKSVWRSLKATIKESLKRRDIEHLERRMIHARGQLTVAYLLYMNEGNQKGHERLQTLSKANGSAVVDAIQTTSNNLRTDIEVLSKTMSSLAVNDPHNSQLIDSFYTKHEKLLQDFATTLDKGSTTNTDTLHSLTGKLDAILGRISYVEGGEATARSESVEESYQAARLAILGSLYSPEMSQRREQISPKHEATLEWALKCKCKNHSESTKDWNCLVHWLESPTLPHIYWIAGKPGSGKSTLLRHLTESAKVDRLLNSWAQNEIPTSVPHQITTVSYFFWNSGSEIQRSLTGCLRSLLHQLLHKSSSPMSTSLSVERWHNTVEGVRHQPSVGRNFAPLALTTWSVMELLETICAFIAHMQPGQVVLFLIDGLDEVQGNDEDRTKLVKYLKRIANFPHAKVCLSSRPWNLFNDAFGNGYKLRMESLNEGDIRNFVTAELGFNNHFLEMQSYFPSRAEYLTNGIVERSSGVFLWVYLVVRDLLRSLRDGTGIDGLIATFEEMPVDLHSYFEFMMQSVEPAYRMEGSIFLQLRLASNSWGPLYMAFLSPRSQTSLGISRSYALRTQHLQYVDARKPRADFLFSLKTRGLKTPDQQNTEYDLKRIERRLNSRCLGLLEVTHIGVVEYMHRSVREFLCTEEAKTLLHQYSKGPFDTMTFFLHLVTADTMSNGVKLGKHQQTAITKDLLFISEVLNTRPTPEPVLEGCILNTFGPLLALAVDDVCISADTWFANFIDPPRLAWNDIIEVLLDEAEACGWRVLRRTLIDAVEGKLDCSRNLATAFDVPSCAHAESLDTSLALKENDSDREDAHGVNHESDVDKSDSDQSTSYESTSDGSTPDDTVSVERPSDEDEKNREGKRLIQLWVQPRKVYVAIPYDRSAGGGHVRNIRKVPKHYQASALTETKTSRHLALRQLRNKRPSDVD